MNQSDRFSNYRISRWAQSDSGNAPMFLGHGRRATVYRDLIGNPLYQLRIQSKNARTWTTQWLRKPDEMDSRSR